MQAKESLHMLKLLRTNTQALVQPRFANNDYFYDWLISRLLSHFFYIQPIFHLL